MSDEELKGCLEVALQKWGEQLKIVVSLLKREMDKDHAQRDINLLLFLYREKVVCEAVMRQLEELQVIDNAVTKSHKS